MGFVARNLRLDFGLQRKSATLVSYFGLAICDLKKIFQINLGSNRGRLKAGLDV